MRILLDLALEEDLEAVCHRVGGLGAILDLAGELEDVFSHGCHLAGVLNIRVRGLKLNFKQITDNILVVLIRALKRRPERCQNGIERLVCILLLVRSTTLIYLIKQGVRKLK